MEPFSFLRVKIQRGFTLVEMMVVLAIIVTVTAIALFGQSTFNRTLLLTDTAYNIALSIREMQSLGLSSRRYIASGQDVQNAAYGIHMDRTQNTQYILFADISNTPTPSPFPSNCLVGTESAPDEKPGNCTYDTDLTPDGVFEIGTLTRGFTISKFCGKKTNNSTPYCSTDTSTPPLDTMDIVFVRSSTESAINALRNGTWEELISAEIYVSSADSLGTRGICISRVGQVSVTQGTCP